MLREMLGYFICYHITYNYLSHTVIGCACVNINILIIGWILTKILFFTRQLYQVLNTFQEFLLLYFQGNNLKNFCVTLLLYFRSLCIHLVLA